MRKFLFLSVASLLMFACSKEESVPLESNDGKLTFEITTSNQMNDGTTRTALYSQDASQKITYVNVYAFKNDGTGNYTYQKTYNIAGWTAGLAIKRYEVPEADKVPAGDYKFLAVGMDSSISFGMTTPTGTTKFEDMMASVTTAGSESELFAGYSQVMVMDKGSRISVEMKRKVGGILGYFKNVPQTINGTPVQYLRLTISNSNLNVNLSNGLGSNPIATSYKIMDIDFTGQTVSNGVYTGNNLTAQGVSKLPNSQLGGTFLMPISGVTMKLGLYDASENALKEWIIEDSNNSPNLNIVANNFYSLGLKTKVDSTNGGGTPDTSDDDYAIDLLLDQSIVITVSPIWEGFHNLIITTPQAPI